MLIEHSQSHDNGGHGILVDYQDPDARAARAHDAGDRQRVLEQRARHLRSATTPSPTRRPAGATPTRTRSASSCSAMTATTTPGRHRRCRQPGGGDGQSLRQQRHRHPRQRHRLAGERQRGDQRREHRHRCARRRRCRHHRQPRLRRAHRRRCEQRPARARRPQHVRQLRLGDPGGQRRDRPHPATITARRPPWSRSPTTRSRSPRPPAAASSLVDAPQNVLVARNDFAGTNGASAAQALSAHTDSVIIESQPLEQHAALHRQPARVAAPSSSCRSRRRRQHRRHRPRPPACSPCSRSTSSPPGAPSPTSR